jgi:class 3 adenylate cyclase/tetratricopeptide (TPR) repeat protein
LQAPAAETAPDLPLITERTVPPTAIEGERKTVTALFADLQGSTELMENLDPEAARAIIDPALKLMIDAVHRYDGYVVQSTGDGIFALFGAPVAHEDHPQRGLYAALRMQQELERYSAKVVADGSSPIQGRVGINTGEVVVRSIQPGAGQVEYTPIGHTTNLASRMQTAAPVGAIAVSEVTRRLCEGYFILKPLGATRVKGLSQPVNVYEVTGLGPLRARFQRAAVRGYTKFVGRQREIETLKHTAELAQAGRGQIVATVAEPGVGKSRLLFEFKAIAQSGWLVLEALSVSHDKATAYLPLIDMLHFYFRIAPEDDARTRREKVAGKIAMLDRSLEQETLPHLFALLGIVEGDDPFAQMDPQVRRRRTQDAVKRVLLRESLNQPLIVVFEDLHWIDSETQSFLNSMADSLGAAKILLLVNYRPEYSHSWGSKTYYTQLRLDPLGRDSADEMLNALLGSDESLEPLKRLVLEHTEGNPLFIEELIEALFEERVLVRNGEVKLTRPLSQLRIPPTVQGILAARIDRLPPEAKDLLQTLAVIGMEFPLSLVRQVLDLPADRLEHLVGNLQTGEFIYEQPAAGDVAYRFKHALTHHEAYHSLLTKRRKLLHERTAQAIEALYPMRLEDHYTDLAHHYGSGSDTAKAIEYLRLTGAQAVDRGAYAQALENVASALRLVELLPDGVGRARAELGVRVLEGRIVTVSHGVASLERMKTSERVCELSEKVGDASALLRGLFNIGIAYANRGEPQRAQEFASRCLQIAEQSQNRELLSLPYPRLLAGRCAYGAGDLLRASSLYGGVMVDCQAAHQCVASGFTPVNPWAGSPAQVACVRLALGRPDEALKLSDEALRRSREFKDPVNLAWVITLAAIVRGWRREPEAVLTLADAEIALAEEHGLRGRWAEGRLFRAWAMAELGHTEQQLVGLEEVVTGATGTSLFRVEMLLNAYLNIGRTDLALDKLSEELARVERTGERLGESELCRLRAEVVLAGDPSATAEAETSFRRAIEVARNQSAKWWELRATISLARLLARQDRRDEARTILTDIYNWFTEGLDTADLIDAKALMEELGK